MNTKHIDQQARMHRRVMALRIELNKGETAPTGWITSKQFAQHLGRTQRWAWEILQDYMEQGLCERRKFKTVTPQHYRYCSHYKLAPKVAAAYGLKLPKTK